MSCTQRATARSGGLARHGRRVEVSVAVPGATATKNAPVTPTGRDSAPFGRRCSAAELEATAVQNALGVPCKATKTPTPGSTHRTFLSSELVNVIVVRSAPRRGRTQRVDVPGAPPGGELGAPAGEADWPGREPAPPPGAWTPQPAVSATAAMTVANVAIAVRRIACTLR